MVRYAMLCVAAKNTDPTVVLYSMVARSATGVIHVKRSCLAQKLCTSWLFTVVASPPYDTDINRLQAFGTHIDEKCLSMR